VFRLPGASLCVFGAEEFRNEKNIPKAVQAGGDAGATSPPGYADIRSLNLNAARSGLAAHNHITIRLEFHLTRIVSEPTGLARFHEFELQPTMCRRSTDASMTRQKCGLAESLRPGGLETAFPKSDLRLE
jgi:hypothetical protein